MAEHQQSLTSFEDAPFLPLHRKIAAGAFLGQICDGYILGIVGIALSYAAKPLGLTSFWMGLIGAGSLLGILFGSLLMGSLADRIGRKFLFCVLMLVSVIVSLAQLLISEPLTLAAVRFLLGMAVGADYAVGIALLSEWTPRKKRGSILAWLLVTWTMGYVLAYCVGVGLQSLGDVSWNWILASSAVLGFITMLVRLGSPESPNWLASKGRTREALEIIRQHLGEGYDLPPTEGKKASTSWIRLFRKPLLYNTIVSGVFFACQVLPFFAISIFLPMVLTELKIENPYATGVLYNVFTMVGVLFGTWLISRISRRAFLLGTFYGGGGLLLILTVWQGMPPYIALAFVAAFALVLAISITLEFAYPPELFPTELRGSGVGLTIAISRIGAAGGTFLLPIISEQFGIAASLGGCVATLFLGGVICHMWAPETSEKFMGDTPKVDGVPVPAVALRS